MNNSKITSRFFFFFFFFCGGGGGSGGGGGCRRGWGYSPGYTAFHTSNVGYIVYVCQLGTRRLIEPVEKFPALCKDGSYVSIPPIKLVFQKTINRITLVAPGALGQRRIKLLYVLALVSHMNQAVDINKHLPALEILFMLLAKLFKN